MSPIPNTVFVLGAGFSVEQGYPLVNQMKNDIICFLNKEQHSSYRTFMQPGDGGCERGRFFDGLEKIDESGELQFEELLLKLLEKIKCKNEDPYLRTNEVLRIGARRLLWEIYRSVIDVNLTYKFFANQFRAAWHQNGIISFNWDLQAERLLHQAGVPWHYDVTAQGRLPVIKPHGSINWSGYLRKNLLPFYSKWQPIRPGSKLSFDCNDPLENPDKDGIHPNLSYMIFPGDPEYDEDSKLLWKDAASLMDRAEKVVFIGYSFPQYDKCSREFFKTNVRGKRLVAVNPSPDHLREFETVLGGEAAEIELRKEIFSKCPYAKPTNDT